MTQRRTLAVLGVAALALVALVLAPKAPHGEPYTPAPDEVLERAGPPRTRSIGPASPEEAAAQALELIAQARRSGGDPRLLGRAQAVLTPWWERSDVPPTVLLARATIRQSFHDFEGALRDLGPLLAAEPTNAQAWLTQATVLQVLARYDEAEASCAHLDALASRLVATVCHAQVKGLRGQAGPARDSLAAALAGVTGEERAWASSVLGDLTLWAGDAPGALARYGEALSLDPADEYTRGAKADVLLDLGHSAEVVALLEGHTQVDAQALRLAIAHKRLKDDAAEASVAVITERVEAGRARADIVHRREEARFALELEEDPARALELAEANWKVQREPADARVLLESARAAKQPLRAAPVLEWLKISGFEDPTVRRLAVAP